MFSITKTQVTTVRRDRDKLSHIYANNNIITNTYCEVIFLHTYNEMLFTHTQNRVKCQNVGAFQHATDSFKLMTKLSSRVDCINIPFLTPFITTTRVYKNIVLYL